MIRLVVDISLSPAWVAVFTKHGWPADHWSAVGDPHAKDRIVMAWARENAHVVFTHDLDFGTLLALTRATGPSVIQVRTHDVLPEHSKTSSSRQSEGTNPSYAKVPSSPSTSRGARFAYYR